MSWETQSWAAKQRPGSASAKLVLLGLASCADQNHCAFPSIQWLCDFSDLNRKTVIAALQRLEDGMFPLITDTGDRRGRTGQVKVYQLAVNEGSGREIGAQIHYCYRLIHPETGQYYIGVRSFIGDPLTDTYSGSGKWPLEMKAAGVRLEKEVLAIKDTRDEADIAEALAIKNSIGDPRCMNIEYKDTEKGVPKTGLLKNTKNGTIEDANSPNLGSKQSQKRDTEPFREPNPPSSPNGDDPPKPKKSVRSEGEKFALAPDWQAPDLDKLPAEVAALVRQWPSGAYAVQCGSFRNHWTAIDRRKRTEAGWLATLANWLGRVHPEVIRAAKAGVSFEQIPADAHIETKPVRPVKAKEREDRLSSDIHTALRKRLGGTVYGQWFAPIALLPNPAAETLDVVVNSEFAGQWLDQHYRDAMIAATIVSGVIVHKVNISVEAKGAA